MTDSKSIVVQTQAENPEIPTREQLMELAGDRKVREPLVEYKALFGEKAPDSDEVLLRLNREAIGVLDQALRGKKVRPFALDAAKFVLGRTLWRMPAESKTYNLVQVFTSERLMEAKRRAGLLAKVIESAPTR